MYARYVFIQRLVMPLSTGLELNSIYCAKFRYILCILSLIFGFGICLEKSKRIMNDFENYGEEQYKARKDAEQS